MPSPAVGRGREVGFETRSKSFRMPEVRLAARHLPTKVGRYRTHGAGFPADFGAGLPSPWASGKPVVCNECCLPPHSGHGGGHSEFASGGLPTAPGPIHFPRIPCHDAPGPFWLVAESIANPSVASRGVCSADHTVGCRFLGRRARAGGVAPVVRLTHPQFPMAFSVALRTLGNCLCRRELQ